ncbi:MAG: hypothetical protein A3I38_02840 [Candidatus Wildermuthbacteria bacterium RIFCSPLOWO2_02_FULL_47_10]|nr:MAG: hypothetical protein A3I38_02840 [Candidatus Wildermuthbacteria bacterium RIFCSPLOWO2_02_FULL_47_10]
MAKAIINIKTEKEIKRNAQKLAEELGISLSDVLNASIRNFIRTREIRISSVPQMTPEFERFLGLVEQDIAAKKNLSPAFETSDGLEHYLASQ